MIILIGIAVAIAAYLIGSVNPSIILSKALAGEDIRSYGSGNAGATNMLRTYGKKMAIATLLLDILKGVIAVLAAHLVDDLLLCYIPTTNEFSKHIVGSLPYIAGLFVALGHNFPVFFGFKGGKGVATGLGVLLTLNWQVGLICLVVAVSIMAISRYVSLGSIIGAGLFPILLLAFSLESGEIDIFSIILAIALAVLIIARHHSNIGRLMRGEENKLFSKKD
ncbi:MAG: glycerol-3-phosphate 1-O-acyltransferase PlsY [Eubacteriales bacterium]|nr:glycerol-3-phosphate 1-O-acyltransferase PlsY [Eubacteriales bacterium]